MQIRSLHRHLILASHDFWPPRASMREVGWAVRVVVLRSKGKERIFSPPEISRGGRGRCYVGGERETKTKGGGVVCKKGVLLSCQFPERCPFPLSEEEERSPLRLISAGGGGGGGRVVAFRLEVSSSHSEARGNLGEKKRVIFALVF